MNMKNAICITFMILLCSSSCTKSTGIHITTKTNVNNSIELKSQIERTINYINNNRPNELLELFNDKISLGGDMIIDLSDLRKDFETQGGKYATIYNSKIYYNKYIATGQIRHGTICKENQLCIKDALSSGINNGLIIEIYNQNGNQNAAYVSINWQPISNCEETLTCVLNYSLINNKWKLTNLDWRQNF